MAFDLGALVTRMVVEGRGQFENDINAGGAALGRAARQGDDFGLALGTMSTGTRRFSDGVAIAGAEVLSLGERGRIAFQQVGTGLTIAGLAIGALVGLAVAKSAEYEAAISRSVAVTGVYGDELARVRELTLELGASTVFTAKEAAEGVTELGKSGIKTADILGGALRGSLSLAAAGELEVADAAAVTASTLNQFNLEGRDAVHVSDLLAAGAGKAQGSVSDMGMALKQSGLVANQMGLSVEDATGTLAAFASAGLLGSDAGTSFRTMLLNLATPTGQQRDLMKEFNIQAYDAQGNFVGITSLAGQLKSAFVGSTQAQRDYALGIIFGSDAIRAANVLYKEGAEGIQGWIGAVDDAGYAAGVAATNTDNLKGDLEKLNGALDTALIKTGAGANGVLRDLIQSTTELVDGFAQLPDWLQQVILGGAALAAGLLLLAGATTIGISKMIEMRAALAIIRAEMPLTTGALSRVSSFLAGPWGIAIAAAVIGVQLLSDYLESLQASSDEMAASLRGAKSAADIFATATKGLDVKWWTDASTASKNLDKDLQSTADQWNNLWLRFNNDFSDNATADALGKIGDELGKLVSTELPTAQHAFSMLAAETDGTDRRLWQLLSSMPAYRDALIVQATATGDYAETMSDAEKKSVLLKLAQEDSAGAAQAAADSYTAAADEAQELADQLTDLIDLVNEANGVGQDAVSSNAAYQDSLAGITAEINSQRDAYIEATGTADGFSVSLDENTVAGSANAAMLAGVAKDAQDAAAAQYEVDLKTMSAKDATDKYIATLGTSREALIEQAIQNGFTATEVQKLIDKVYAMPSQVATEAIVNTSRAQQAIADLKWSLAAFQNSSYGVNVSGYIKSTERAQGGIDYVRHMAAGGIMSNAGAQPQIRRAGDLTVWAEHETGGEAYVPFALDRRARSEAIMSAVASIFGGTYVPAGARAMAAGGMDAPAGFGAGKTVNLGGIHLHNPIVKDLVEDAREAAQTAVAVLSV